MLNYLLIVGIFNLVCNFIVIINVIYDYRIRKVRQLDQDKAFKDMFEVANNLYKQLQLVTELSDIYKDLATLNITKEDTQKFKEDKLNKV